MPGLYIHIPFCRKACHYCDFHFSISLKHLEHMLDAIQKELAERSNEQGGINQDTLYLGGGTPSLLSIPQLENLMRCVHDHYILEKHAEITMEANPDDLTKDYLEALSGLGINRLSIGIQSFDDGDLTWMNRTHNRQEGLSCLENAMAAGFKNLNIDLIYGIPGSGLQGWKANLETAMKVFPAHISAYHLTYEKGSVMEYHRIKQKISAIDENQSMEQFNWLIDTLEEKGYCHYEISNFARDGKFSKHNMAYWTGEPYLGFGPSAHSYDGQSRRWNLSRNSSYMKALQTGEKYYETEVLTPREAYHDFILTRLRTHKGIDTKKINEIWGGDFLQHFMQGSRKFLAGGKLLQTGNTIRLTREGMFISDHILSALFMPT